MLKYNFTKYIIISILFNTLTLGSLGLNINIHQCSQGENLFVKIVLPWTTDNNCELCHDEDKIELVEEVHSCCQSTQKEKKKEEKKDCCKEKEFIVKNDLKINKVVYLVLSKVDNKIKHLEKLISKIKTNHSFSNIILIPPNLRVILQSLTI